MLQDHFQNKSIKINAPDFDSDDEDNETDDQAMSRIFREKLANQQTDMSYSKSGGPGIERTSLAHNYKGGVP